MDIFATLIEISSTLSASVATILDAIDQALVGFAALGVLSLAIVNLIKKMTSAAYYRLFIRWQFRTGLATCNTNDLEEFLYVVASGNKKAFYDQELLALFQSINSVVTQALNSPDNEDNQCIIKAWLPVASHPTSLKSDFEQDVASLITAYESGDANEYKTLKPLVKEAVDAQLRGLKSKMDRCWRRTARLGSIFFALIIAFVVLSQETGAANALIFGLVSGLFAPFAHDLLNRVKAARLK